MIQFYRIVGLGIKLMSMSILNKLNQVWQMLHCIYIYIYMYICIHVEEDLTIFN